MTSTTMQRLQECDLMLANICTHYGTLLKQLSDAQPGYPTRTPGSGEPGAGKGFTAGSTTERLAGQHSPELDDLKAALELPGKINAIVYRAAIGASVELRFVPQGPRRTLRQLVWTRWIIRQLIEQEHQPSNRTLAALHHHIRTLDAIVRRWPTPTVPKTTATNKLADDLTDMWCRNCLNIGAREPRWRGTNSLKNPILCRWCYEFNNTNGFYPPAGLLRIRQAKSRVTSKDVDPFLKAWNERNKRKRKKAG